MMDNAIKRLSKVIIKRWRSILSLTIPITAKIMGATMNQVDEYQKVLNDLNS